MRGSLRCVAACLLLGAVALPAAAEVVRVDIRARQPYAEGRTLGGRGPWETWTGTVRYALDPRHAANRGIVDLDLAPRDAAGRVEFSADVELIVPVDRTQANGGLFYEVNNRGRKTAPNMFDTGADEFLLRQGYVVCWSGWIAEVQPGGGLLRCDVPVPLVEGRPLRGPVRAEVVVDKDAESAPICHRGAQGSYRPAKDALASAKLTRRVREADPREDVPRDQWSFEIEEFPGGQLPVVRLKVEGGLKAGTIHEVVYEAEGGLVAGAGLAAIRDLVSFLKYEASDRNPLVRDGKSLVARSIGFGTSQSGRLLRQFLYDGFNADEQGRLVFDGVLSHVAGGGLGSFNHRFASPTRTNGQHDEHSFPADRFPFTYGDSQDPFTGREDGILRRARQSRTVPRTMHTQSSSEYWHRAGSLVHTDPLGNRDAEIPPEVRLYTFAGTQHAPGSGRAAPRSNGVVSSNPTDYRPLLRALLVALDAWIVRGTEPPPSTYPKIADRTLVPWTEKESGWTAIPGVPYPAVIHRPACFERGPDWETLGRAAFEPPRWKGPYVVRVPAFGPDGNERGCLAVPDVAVPTASRTGWNLRHESIGAAGELFALQGGHIPFAKTEPDRTAARDPRPSLEARYGSFANFRSEFLAAAKRLVEQRYLLPEDLPRQEAFVDSLRPLFAK